MGYSLAVAIPQTGAANTMVVNAPAGTAEERDLILILGRSGGDPTTFTGFTQKGTGRTNNTFLLYRWVPAGTEPSTYSVTCANAITQAVCIRIRGGLGFGDPFVQLATATAVGNATVSASLGSSVPVSQLIMMVDVMTQTRTVTVPGGYNQLTSGSQPVHVIYREQATAGSTGSVAMVMNTATTHSAWFFALKPVPIRTVVVAGAKVDVIRASVIVSGVRVPMVAASVIVSGSKTPVL